MKIISFFICGVLSLFNSLHAQEQPLVEQIYRDVLAIIEHSETIPGLQYTEFSTLKEGLISKWNDLFKAKNLSINASDKEVRPYFVALQAIFEHVIASKLGKEIKTVTGIIHTPLPATPLCNEGSISQKLVAPSIAEDPLRMLTVKARTTTVRDYLHRGGFLYVVYPKSGLNRRTAIQQKIYQQELINFSSNLFDWPLNCESIENSLIGATYFFTDKANQTLVFAIQMTQANDPQEKGQFGLWFGEGAHPSIQGRISKILAFIRTYSSTAFPSYSIMIPR